jgi:hypothetical protein
MYASYARLRTTAAYEQQLQKNETKLCNNEESRTRFRRARATACDAAARRQPRRRVDEAHWCRTRDVKWFLARLVRARCRRDCGRNANTQWFMHMRRRESRSSAALEAAEDDVIKGALMIYCGGEIINPSATCGGRKAEKSQVSNNPAPASAQQDGRERFLKACKGTQATGRKEPVMKCAAERTKLVKSGNYAHIIG